MKKYFKYGCVGCITITICVIAVVAFIFYLNTPKWDDEMGYHFENLSYGKEGNNTYDLYLPKDTTHCNQQALMLFLHGGSWLGGDKDEYKGECYRWVQNGYATATMNYRFLGKDSSNTCIPGMLDDIESCISHIIQKAKTEGYNITQMAIGGMSAGGHLAMLYAYSRPHQIPIVFEAIKVGPSDFTVLFPYDEQATVESIKDLTYNCTGEKSTKAVFTQAYQDSIKLLASPINYISDSTALPAIWAYGKKDWLVIPKHYELLKEKYDSLHKVYKLIVYPNSDHILMNDPGCTKEYDLTIQTYAKQYFGY